MENVVGKDLEEGDRVFHMNGDRGDNNPRNLVVIHFNQTRYTMLRRSKILYVPKTLDEIIRVVMPNKRERVAVPA